jgi:serine carboxypeptidase-like clade I
VTSFFTNACFALADTFLDGGPGASSMFGLLTELGNLLFSDNSLRTNEYRATGIPTPIYNPNSWTRLGHLLSFDQPAPIGFSYCGTDDPNNITHPHSCDGIVWDDTLTAQAAHRAMIAFYNKFPSFYDVDLYLTGESYAGIYIPTLAREIVQNNVNHSPAISSKLRGFAVGDGCLGNRKFHHHNASTQLPQIADNLPPCLCL